MAGTLVHRSTLVSIEARSILALDLACAVVQVGVDLASEVPALAPALVRNLANLAGGTANRTAGSGVRAAGVTGAGLTLGAAAGAADPGVRAARASQAGFVAAAAIAVADRPTAAAPSATRLEALPPLGAAVGAAIDRGRGADARPVLADLA
jgi:hypothetical protein